MAELRSSIQVTDPEEASKTRLILWIFSASYVVLLIPAFLLVILFGASLPAVEMVQEHWLTLLYISLLTYPVVALVCLPVSWSMYRRKAYRSSVLVAAIPSLNVVVSLVAMLNLF